VNNHSRDYDKTVALLKSVAAPCESRHKSAEHNWRYCRHCLAVAELEHADVRARLGAFIEAVEAADCDYGRPA
jgi:hypothetical protein